MSEEGFGAVAIIGVGLLGASLGRALKARNLAGSILGVGRREATLDKALAARAIDTAHTNAREAAAAADVVVICTPAALVCGKLDEIRDACKPESVVTDVASTKAAICAHAVQSWPKPLRFVGAHPMAGSEKFGPEHAVDDLYEGAVTFICPQQSEPEATSRIKRFWESVGSTVLTVDAAGHDDLVARTSHVPHIAAAALALLADGGDEVVPFVGKGFRDATRIAAGRPEIWRDICLTNRAAISDELGQYITRLQEVCALIENSDAEALQRFFSDARDARSRVAGP